MANCSEFTWDGLVVQRSEHRRRRCGVSEIILNIQGEKKPLKTVEHVQVGLEIGSMAGGEVFGGEAYNSFL